MPASEFDTAYGVRYERWTRALRRRPGACALLRVVGKGLTIVFYGAYAALIGWMLLVANDPIAAAPLAAVPGAAFLLVSWYRRRFNAPRPYERCALDPLVPRDGEGQSFPSRHAFSAFAIATCWFAVSVPVAVALLAAAAVLACCRVLGGVHFPRDVVVGAVLGATVGAAACLGVALI